MVTGEQDLVRKLGSKEEEQEISLMNKMEGRDGVSGRVVLVWRT